MGVTAQSESAEQRPAGHPAWLAGLSPEPWPALGGRARWLLFGYAVAAIVLGLLLFRAMAPGGITYDTRFQLQQALGEVPFNDWHPVIMAGMWKGLIGLTGQISSMAALQIGLAVVFSILCSYTLMVSKGGPAWGALGLAPMLLPNTVNLWGVVWKDVHLTLALSLCLILLILARYRPRWFWVLVSLAMLCLLYAVLVRKNAFVVALPVVSIAVVQATMHVRSRGTRGLPGGRRILVMCLAGVLAFGVAVVGSSKIVDAVYTPTKNSQFAQVMLDDLIFSIPADKLLAARSGTPELRAHLVEAQGKCAARGAIWDAYWLCYGGGANGPFTSIVDVKGVQDLWLELIPSHAGWYLDYRAQTMTHFLVTSKGQFARNVDVPGQVTQHSSVRLHEALRDYVVSLGVKQLPWLYHGWFWVSLAAAGLVLTLRRRWRDLMAAGFLAAGLLYLATYIPTAPAQDYRYVFPAVMTTMLAGVAVLCAGGRSEARLRSGEADS